MLPDNQQKGKFQISAKHLNILSRERSSQYDGGHNAGTLHSALQYPVL